MKNALLYLLGLFLILQACGRLDETESPQIIDATNSNQDIYYEPDSYAEYQVKDRGVCYRIRYGYDCGVGVIVGFEDRKEDFWALREQRRKRPRVIESQ